MTQRAEGIPIEQQLALATMFGSLMSGTALQQFAAVSRDVFIPAGKVIYEQGDRSQHVHFILEGRVELAGEDEEPWYFDGRSLIGVLDAELGRDYTRTARAISDVRMVVLDVEDWNDVIEDNIELTSRNMKRSHQRWLRLSAQLGSRGGFVEPEPHSQRLSVMFGAMASKLAPERLNPFERLLTLRLCPLFGPAGIQALISVARAATVRLVPAESTVAHEGDPAASFFIVAHGSVVAERASPPMRATFGSAELVAGYAGFAHDEWPLSLRAAVDTTLLEIAHNDLHDVMEDHYDLVRAIRAYTASEIERMQLLVVPT